MQNSEEPIFTFSRDITDRKKAEENLRDSERRYRELVETISDGIVQTNRLGTVTFANAAYCRMLGFTMEEMIGKSILEFQVTDSKREEMRAYLDDVCREKPAVIPWFGNHRTRDGVMLFVQADWNYRLDHLGNVIGFISVVKDITERKKAEEALRESEERYRKVFEQGPLGMALVGPDYRFREVNRILCDMLGYKEHELKDLTFVDVTHPDHISEDLKHARQLKTGEIPYYKTEKRYIMQDGGILWANLVASVIRAGEGNVLYTLAMIEDITDRKRVEEQIKNSLREKEVLLREVHHRVKNNLAVVHSLLRLQSKGARDDFHQRMFEDAQDRIRSMALAHERLCQSDDLANVNMNEYMIGLVDHLVQTQKGIGPTFVVEKHIESAHLGLDKAVPLGFLINELVSNSLKHAYTNRTQGTLLISFRRLDEKEYELIVKDDGTGFPEGVDLESPQSLGLSLVKLFTKQIDGEIKLLRDEGTEFRIEFSDSP